MITAEKRMSPADLQQLAATHWAKSNRFDAGSFAWNVERGVASSLYREARHAMGIEE